MSKRKAFLPYGKQCIGEDDIAAVEQVLRGDYLTTGPAVAVFESAFASAVGSEFAMVCANGTAALHLGALALGLGPGDTVLAPSLSFLATANGPHYTGAQVVFMDCDPDTALVRPVDVENAILRAEGQVKAIYVTHMNGQVCDVEEISKIAKRVGAYLIEDACHAIGTRFIDRSGVVRTVGDCAFSDMANFSLHPVKTITMGEGGVVTTRDQALYDEMCRLRTHGMTRKPEDFASVELAFGCDGLPNPWYYEMQSPGYNYRATDFQCALGASQLAKLSSFAARRKAITAVYDSCFAGHSGAMVRFGTVENCDPVLHLYVALVDFGAIGTDRAAFMRKLHERGIGTQVHYLPIHLQPYYAALNPGLVLEGAETYYQRCLSLPIYPAMQDEDAEWVFSVLVEMGA